MKSFRDRNPYAVGLVSVALIGLLTGIAFMIGLLRILEDAYEMEGTFSDASGLRAGDDVRVAGVKVGRVTSVQADRSSGNVTVEWVINSGVEVHNGAGAEIALASLLGPKQLRINDPMAGTERFEDLPREQRVIPIERTKTPFDVFELTRVATEGIQELNTEDVNQLINELADVTEGKQATLAELTDGISRVSQTINSRDAELERLLDQADRLAATLNDKDEEILALIDASDEILDLIIDRRNQLAVVLGESADVVGELDRIIGTHRATLDSILDALAPTLDAVARQQDDLDRALAWIGPALLQQSKGGSHGPWQDIYVQSLGPDAVAILQDLYSQLLGLEAGTSGG